MGRRTRSDESGVKFLQPQEFEDEAAMLLAEYAREHGLVTAPPVPIDMIAVAYCKLALEYGDLAAKYPEGGVDGEIWFRTRRIVVEQRLAPEVNPSMLGRFRFTVAHELAHWRLHRHAFLRWANERPLFAVSAEVDRPDHVLRSRQLDQREYQANRLGACILMPREMVKRAWHEMRGSMEPICLRDLREGQHESSAAADRRLIESPPREDANDNVLLDGVARQLARPFEVSPEAMRIRLETLGLLHRAKDSSLFR